MLYGSGDAVKQFSKVCSCSMIMTPLNCSVKMSLDEGVHYIDQQGATETHRCEQDGPRGTDGTGSGAALGAVGTAGCVDCPRPSGRTERLAWQTATGGGPRPTCCRQPCGNRWCGWPRPPMRAATTATSPSCWQSGMLSRCPVPRCGAGGVVRASPVRSDGVLLGIGAAGKDAARRTLAAMGREPTPLAGGPEAAADLGGGGG